MADQLISRAVAKVYQSDAPYAHGVRCGTGGCPAVFATDQGTYLVVGRRLNAAEKAGLSIDPIEDALEIPADLLDGVLKQMKR